ncbi:hypothetical protein CPB84DRAFT_1765031 [Gymnopilus junonius]|uniref:Uncharacterized protein n=1 Tax=Gymnopilus junonius TaxID=109634 RepID=A0A9P5NX94_GYMJU|nr:hypothetical protein CPB84DRAFT_1765031 [Gymnopilus junonius]
MSDFKRRQAAAVSEHAGGDSEDRITAEDEEVAERKYIEASVNHSGTEENKRSRYKEVPDTHSRLSASSLYFPSRG